MSNLIKVEYQDSGRITTSARTLWEGLGKPYRDFNPWFDKYKDYGFIDGEDYRLITVKVVTNNPKNPVSEATDYEITLEMGKQLAMLQKSEKGKQYRDYFIDLEKMWNSPEFVMKRAYEFLNKKCETLQYNLDEAIKTKAYISDKKTATAMNKASQLSKENKKLNNQLGEGDRFVTVLVMEKKHNTKFPHHPLVKYCKENNIIPVKVPDRRYGEVNSYPVEVWQEVYGVK